MSTDTIKIKKQILIIIKMLEALRKLYQLLFRKKLCLVHHTATSRDYTKFITIDDDHEKRGYSESKKGCHCAYNEIITGDGIRHIARYENENGRGALTCPDFHYDLCLTGNFNVEQLSKEQETILIKVLDDFVKRGYVIKLHQNYYATDCPGKNLITWLIENGYYKRS